MRRCKWVPICLLLACGGATHQTATARTASSQDAAYSCMLAAIAAQGLTVAASDRPSLIRAELVAHPTMAPGALYYVFTVTIFEDSSGTEIRVAPHLDAENMQGVRERKSWIRDEDNQRAARLAKACE